MKNRIIGVGLTCFMIASAFSPISAFASTNGFVSDTTTDVTIPQGSSYTLKITPDTSSDSIAVTIGNSNVAQIVKTEKIDKSQYITVVTNGKTAECTGLYVTDNNKRTHLLNVTVGYPMNITGQHKSKSVDSDGKVTEFIAQDKGWQIQIEVKPIHFQIQTEAGTTQQGNITIDSTESEINTTGKYLLFAFNGNSEFLQNGVKFTNASGEELPCEQYNKYQFKVSYDNIDDIKTMYFGTNTEKATLHMIYFE